MSEREQGQLRRSAGLRAGLAVVIATATGAAVVAVPNQTAAASMPTVYGVNRSANPVLARSSVGFSTQEGASQPRRIQIRQYRGARHAARVVSNAATVRIVEPRAAVTPGQTWIFASDVKARRGAAAHISVSWFDRNGNFLRWTGGNTRSVRLSDWTRVRAALPVPRGASTGQTVVNVLNSRPGSPVLVTRHEVKAPLASTLPTPTTPIISSMQPPAGATLVRTCHAGVPGSPSRVRTSSRRRRPGRTATWCSATRWSTGRPVRRRACRASGATFRVAPSRWGRPDG